MKVILRIRGGLGNQLFEYAAARRLALVNNAQLVLDNVSGFRFDHAYQQRFQLGHFNITAPLATSAERLEPFARVRRFVMRWASQRVSFNRRKYILQESNEFDSRLLQLKLRSDLYIEGYWQSEKYFADIAQVIRNDLLIKPPLDALNLHTANLIQSCIAVAVHVRFFDTPGTNEHNNVNEKYYADALDLMKKRVPDAHYFLFSNDVDAARSLTRLSENQITVVSHNQGDENAYADLWLMTQCKHFIIANSTFSWWGAWLSAHLDKIVIAPGFVLQGSKTAWGFDGLLPEQWIKI